MRAFRAKTRNRTPCRGVIGGVREIPPDRKGKLKRKIAVAGTRRTRREVFAVNITPVAVRTNTIYDNANVTTLGLIRVLITCLTFLVYIMLNL
jgi:hypothetical protein